MMIMMLVIIVGWSAPSFIELRGGHLIYRIHSFHPAIRSSSSPAGCETQSLSVIVLCKYDLCSVLPPHRIKYNGMFLSHEWLIKLIEIKIKHSPRNL